MLQRFPTALDNHLPARRKAGSAIDEVARKPLPVDAEHHDVPNAALGFRFVRALAVEKAVLDPRLTPKEIRVLAAISYHMNARIMRAWPSYKRISEIVGYTHETIERAIKNLIDCGYLFRERRAPITGGRALVHYGLKSMTFDDIEVVITAAVEHLRSTSEHARSGRSRLTPLKTQGSGALTPLKRSEANGPHPAHLVTSDPDNLAAPQSAQFADSNPGDEHRLNGTRDTSLRECGSTPKRKSSEVISQGARNIRAAVEGQRLPGAPRSERDWQLWLAQIDQNPLAQGILPTDATALARAVADRSSRGEGKTPWFPSATDIDAMLNGREFRFRQRTELMARYETEQQQWEQFCSARNKLHRIQAEARAIAATQRLTYAEAVRELSLAQHFDPRVVYDSPLKNSRAPSKPDCAPISFQWADTGRGYSSALSPM